LEWHNLDASKVSEALQSSPDDGLTDSEAKTRLEKQGPNELEEEEENLLETILEPFKEPMMLLLIATGIIYSIFGEPSDAVAIFIIIAIIGLVEVVQERRAENSIKALKSLTAPIVNVVREGREHRVSSSDLVSGDLVLLEAGDRVSADIRLVESVNLRAEESTLTGESIPAEKDASQIFEASMPLAERSNMVYSGTTIVHGKGRGLVVATAMGTEVGRIAGLVKESGDKQTPLQKQMSRLTGWFAVGSLSVCMVVVLAGIVKGQPFIDMLLYGLSLAVSTIPEDLPIILTIILVLSVRRMAKQNALVKRLYSVETLGSTTIICSDKTGTLTQNKMTAKTIQVEGVTLNLPEDKLGPNVLLALNAGALCSDVRLERGINGFTLVGDPTEKALVEAALHSGVDVIGSRGVEPMIGEFSFDNERKLMSTVHSMPDKRLRVYTKGAPEAVLSRCTRVVKDTRIIQLGEDEKARFLEENTGLAGRGLRVIAIAYRELGREVVLTQNDVERDLAFIAFVGLMDPPRPEVKAAISECREAGIRTVMITGDHPLTASAVARDLDLSHNPVTLTGRDINSMDDHGLSEAVTRADIYARVTPENKLRIVQALKSRGEVVAMTGDGVNDAPALREADIGVAMGETGTDVAREAAAMVLADDNFATIVEAVREGRRVFDNLNKAITYYISTKIAVLGIAIASVALGLPLPLAPIQIILMEVLTDVVASTSFEAEAPESDLMRRPPRRRGGFASSRAQQVRVAVQGLSIVAGVLLLFYYILSYGSIDRARTVAFAATLFSIVFLAFNSRSNRESFLSKDLFANRNMALTGLASLLVAVLAIELPSFQGVFKTVPLTLLEWGLIICVSLAASIWIEVGKLLHLNTP
jgi:Ca2+-transporting ATPase